MTLQQSLALIALALAGVEAGLKASGTLTPEQQKILGYIAVAMHAITSATEAVQQAQQGVDPTKLNRIEEVE